MRELAAGVEDQDKRLKLSLQACQQIFFLAWRVGGSDEEFASVFAEGRALAEQIGDRPALAMLVGLYGAMRGHLGGAAPEFVRYGEEAARIAAECGDPALFVAIGTLPMFGYHFTGEGLATVAWADRILAKVGSDNAFGKAVTGYSPRAGALQARTVGLVYLGRLEEARLQAEEAVRVAEATEEFEVLGWILLASVLQAYACGQCLTRAVALWISPKSSTMIFPVSSDISPSEWHIYSTNSQHLRARRCKRVRQ